MRSNQLRDGTRSVRYLKLVRVGWCIYARDNPMRMWKCVAWSSDKTALINQYRETRSMSMREFERMRRVGDVKVEPTVTRDPNRSDRLIRKTINRDRIDTR